MPAGGSCAGVKYEIPGAGLFSMSGTTGCDMVSMEVLYVIAVSTQLNGERRAKRDATAQEVGDPKTVQLKVIDITMR